MSDTAQPQLLHLVIGGELEDIEGVTFKDLSKVDLVGVYPNYAEAERVWRQLLPTIPADSQFRTITEQRLQALAQARASGEIPPAEAAAPEHERSGP